MAKIKADEITELLRQQIENYEQRIQVDEAGISSCYSTRPVFQVVYRRLNREIAHRMSKGVGPPLLGKLPWPKGVMIVNVLRGVVIILPLWLGWFPP